MRGEIDMYKTTKKLTLSAMFIAVGMVLPLLTGQIQQIGSTFLPMHLPVILCGLICGWQYGALIGFILPFLRSVTFGMPPLFPTAIAMAFELATYGLVIGLIYGRSHRQCVISLYRSLIADMLAGRIVWGIVQIVLLGLIGKSFTWQMFIAGALLNAVPGIVVQLTLIPTIMVALNRTGLVIFQRKQPLENLAVR